jgi:hypothetical protein
VTREALGGLGFEYIRDLCTSIANATESAKRADPTARVYRGVDLAYSVERELYFSLVNNLDLQRAYEQQARGLSPGALRVAHQLEREVVLQLLPAVEAEWMTPSNAAGVWQAVREARNAVGRERRRRYLARRSDLRTRSIVFIVHHRKFLRFLEPVLRCLDPADVAIAWTGDDLTEQAGALGLSAVEVFEEVGRGRLPPSLVGANSPWAYDSLARLFAVGEPRTLVVIEGNNPWDEVASRFARQTGSRCFCLQHGWSPFVHTGFRNMSFTSMLVWGQGFAELLAPFNLDESFTVTGNPMFGVMHPREAPGLSRGDPGPCVAFFLQPPSPFLSPDRVDDLYLLAAEFARRFPDARILVREHPSAPIPREIRARLLGSPQIALAPPHEVPLTDVLEQADVSLSIYSTTILESIAALKPPVIYNATSFPHYSPDVNAAGAGIEVSTREAALEALGRLVTDPAYRASFEPAMRAFRTRFFSDEVDPAARIATIVSG